MRLGGQERERCSHAALRKHYCTVPPTYCDGVLLSERERHSESIITIIRSPPLAGGDKDPPMWPMYCIYRALDSRSGIWGGWQSGYLANGTQYRHGRLGEPFHRRHVSTLCVLNYGAALRRDALDNGPMVEYIPTYLSSARQFSPGFFASRPPAADNPLGHFHHKRRRRLSRHLRQHQNTHTIRTRKNRSRDKHAWKLWIGSARQELYFGVHVYMLYIL